MSEPNSSGNSRSEPTQATASAAVRPHRGLIIAVGMGIGLCLLSQVRFWLQNGSSVLFGLNEFEEVFGDLLAAPLIFLLFLVLFLPVLLASILPVAEFLVVWGLLGVLFYHLYGTRRPLPKKLTPLVLCRLSPGCLPQFAPVPKFIWGCWPHFVFCLVTGVSMIVVRDGTQVAADSRTLEGRVATWGPAIWVLVALFVAVKTKLVFSAPKKNQPAGGSGH